MGILNQFKTFSTLNVDVFDEKLSQKKYYIIKTEIVLLESMGYKFDIYKLYIATQPVVRDSETLAFF